MANAANSTGARRAGGVWKYGDGHKGWAKTYVSRICRRQGKLLTRKDTDE